MLGAHDRDRAQRLAELAGVVEPLAQILRLAGRARLDADPELVEVDAQRVREPLRVHRRRRGDDDLIDRLGLQEGQRRQDRARARHIAIIAAADGRSQK